MEKHSSRAAVVLLGICAVAAACAASVPGATPPASPSSAAGQSTTGTSAVVLTDDFGGRALFPADNWWNRDVSSAPVDPQSSAFIDFIGRTRTLHPDFGPAP